MSDDASYRGTVVNCTCARSGSNDDGWTALRDALTTTPREDPYCHQMRNALPDGWTDGARRSNQIEIEISGLETVRVLVNENLSMSPKKLAAQAVHAALYAYGIPHGRVVILGGTKRKVEAMPTVIRDAGVTELAPGTVTAGCRIEQEDEHQ